MKGNRSLGIELFKINVHATMSFFPNNHREVKGIAMLIEFLKDLFRATNSNTRDMINEQVQMIQEVDTVRDDLNLRNVDPSV